MFVSRNSVKLVKKQIYVAITAFCGFCDKLPADRILKNSLSLFTEIYAHHKMISVCRPILMLWHVCRTWTVGRRFGAFWPTQKFWRGASMLE